MGGVRRRDSIVRMIRFLKLFYELKPKGSRVTIQKIKNEMQCSRSNARHCIDAAGFEIPICELGHDEKHKKRGPPGIVYGILE
jgi:hypothetical protein